MIIIIVAVRDRAIDSYIQPLNYRTVSEAIRAFGDAINDPGTPMYAHPEDYDMHLLGNFNTETGAYELVKPPQQIAIGKELIRNAPSIQSPEA